MSRVCSHYTNLHFTFIILHFTLIQYENKSVNCNSKHAPINVKFFTSVSRPTTFTFYIYYFTFYINSI